MGLFPPTHFCKTVIILLLSKFWCGSVTHERQSQHTWASLHQGQRSWSALGLWEETSLPSKPHIAGIQTQKLFAWADWSNQSLNFFLMSELFLNCVITQLDYLIQFVKTKKGTCEISCNTGKELPAEQSPLTAHIWLKFGIVIFPILDLFPSKP